MRALAGLLLGLLLASHASAQALACGTDEAPAKRRMGRRAMVASVGTSRYDVIPLNFADTDDPIDAGNLKRVMDATAAYYAESSDGADIVTYAISPAVKLSTPTPKTCDYTSWTGEAWALSRAAGFDPGQNIIYFPVRGLPCPWGGLAAGVGLPPIWVNGAFYPRLVIHEVGHTKGEIHARACFVGTFPGNCLQNEYGDVHSPMGQGDGRFSAIEAARAQWMQEAGLRPIVDATYAINPLEQAGPDRSLMLSTRLSGRNYYVERRLPNGLDWCCVGTIVRTILPSQNTLLVATLTPGGAFEDAEAGIRIEATAGGASVHYFTPAPSSTPTSAPPTATPGGPTPTPTATPDGGVVCRFGFSIVSCTPTPTREPTWTPTPAPTADNAPSSTPSPSPTPLDTPPNLSPTPSQESSTPTATPAPAPRSTATPAVPCSGCDCKDKKAPRAPDTQTALLLMIPVLGFWRSRL